VILQRVEQAEWLSNAYLVIDEPGGHGVLVDSNGVTDPLSERAEREGTEITHVILTHHHWDHVYKMEELAKRFGVPILAHTKTKELLEGRQVDETFTGGDVIESGDLRLEVIETPGHCADHCALKINDGDVITADVLFKGTVGGTRAPGATGVAHHKSTIMDKLKTLEPGRRVHPGHKQPTTIGTEWEENPFIRIWRGQDDEGSEPESIGPFFYD
jgi:glyoxylase-like metal-dependent hydrolase (beta-lactamase superfamily II)